VEVAADLSRVPAGPRLGELMPLCLTGRASPAQVVEFQSLWQDRVRRLLLEFADDPVVIGVSPRLTFTSS